MKKILFSTFFSIAVLLTFLSLPLFAGGDFVEPTPSAAVTATPETPFYPISTTVVVPTITANVPYTPTIDFRELEQIQLIDSETIVYRQWGNLYVHHLTAKTTQLVFGGNGITSFDWSPVRQQFIVTSDGRLLLIDITGEVVKDLSTVLAEDNEFKVTSCFKLNEFVEADSNQIEDAEWGADESTVQFTYDAVDTCYTVSLWELNPDTDVLNLLNMSNDSWIWLNPRTLVSSAYHGGGGRLFSIIDVPNNKTIFTVEAVGTYPVGSSDGSRLAIATNYLRKLIVFDTATGRQLVEQNFGNKDRDEDTIVSAINFSNTGRYVVVQGIMGPESKNLESRYITVIVDIETGTLWPLPTRSQRIAPGIIWLPDRDQALMFEQEDNSTYLSQLLPELQQIVPMGKITDTVAAYTWLGDSRYLLLTDQIFYSAHTGDTNAGIWFWDRQKGGLPYPIYLVTPVVQGDNIAGSEAAMVAPLLSPDETWLVFGQRVGWTMSDNPYYNDVTLEAIHLPSGEHHQVAEWSPPDSQ